MAFISRFKDHFNDGSVGLLISNPNGASITEAGSTLTIAALSSLDLRWWSDGENAPVAYALTDGYEAPRNGVMMVETRMTGFTWGGTTCLGGLAFWTNRDNVYQLGWYPSNSNVYLQLGTNNTFSTITNVAAGNPNTTPHRYRVYWKLGYPSRLSFWYSDDDGATWTQLSTRDEELLGDLSDLKVGPYVRNFSPYPTFSADFDYLEIFHSDSTFAFPEGESDVIDHSGIRKESASLQDDGYVSPAGGDEPHQGGYPMGIVMPGQAHDQAEGRFYRPDKASFQDDGYVAPAGGETPHQGGYPMGIVVPGQIFTQAEGRLSRPDKASFQDDGYVAPTGGDLPHQGGYPLGIVFPGQLHDQAEGRLYRPDKGAPRDRAVWTTSQADYQTGTSDADGYDFLYDTNIQEALPVDTTQDSFGDPTNGSHWGAARDGKFYADGYECAPGDFGTLAGGIRRTAWRAAGIEPLAIPLVHGTSPVLQSDDVLRLSTGGAFTGDYEWFAGAVESCLCWELTGDFDIEVEYSNFTTVSGAFLLFHMHVVSSDRWGTQGINSVRMGRYNNGGVPQYERLRYNNNSGGQQVVVGTSDTAGKIRITRDGTTFHTYYDNSGWVELGSGITDSNIGADPVFVRFLLTATGSTDGYVDITNFTINSGTVTNMAGWAREAAGAHRGLRDDMPTSMLVATTNSSLDLLDRGSTRLWMRFLQGSSNVLGATADGVRTRHAVWHNGVLLVAYGSPSTSEGGAVIAIDFTADLVRWYREGVSTSTGAMYWGTLGRAGGSIAFRNDGKTWTGDDNDWSIPDYRVYDVDIMAEDGYHYRAIATYEGTAMSRWRQWYKTAWRSSGDSDVVSVFSSETGDMRWCEIQPDGYLYYMDDSSIYGAAPHTWRDALGAGPFSRDAEVALAGTRSLWWQHVAEVDGYDIYIPADEGVYKATFPGSFSLFYGKEGSGAVHEILPNYHKITTLKLATFGGDPILLCGMEGFADFSSQIVAINASTNQVWGYSKRLDVSLRSPSVMGVP